MQNIEKCLPLLSVVDGLDIWLASLVMGQTPNPKQNKSKDKSQNADINI